MSYGWRVQKFSNIKWVSNESWMKNWSEHPLVYNYDVSWRVLKSSGPHEFVEILEVLSVEELMRACSWYATLLAICSMLYDWFYYWLYLILVRFSVLLNIKYLKSRVSVNTPCTLSNNNSGFSLWGLTINSLTRIDGDISYIFWAAGVFLCLDQQLPDSHHCSGYLDLK